MIKMVILPDLHWGAIPPERMKQELDETLFPFLEHNGVSVALIAGDLFDSKQYFTSDVVRHVIDFLYKLLEFTDNIICIQGTKTHDDLQLETLKSIFSKVKSIDADDLLGEIHFVTKPTCFQIKYSGSFIYSIKPEEYSYNDSGDYMSILCIPEEYVIDQDEYYKPYLDNKFYDMILFHGMIDKIWYANMNKKSQTDLTKYSSAPVFKVDDLLDHCTKCYAGHIHVHKHYGKDSRFLYVGPFTRWEFGKEDDVGFEFVEFDNHQFTERFIVNKNAPILTTRVLNINTNITLNELNDTLDAIIAKDMVVAERLRFIINLKSNIPNYLEIKDFIISKLGDIKFVKLVLSIDIDDDYMNMTKEAIENKIPVERKNYLFESMELEERIRLFLKQKKGLDISIDDIKSILRAEE